MSKIDIQISTKFKIQNIEFTVHPILAYKNRMSFSMDIVCNMMFDGTKLNNIVFIYERRPNDYEIRLKDFSKTKNKLINKYGERMGISYYKVISKAECINKFPIRITNIYNPVITHNEEPSSYQSHITINPADYLINTNRIHMVLSDERCKNYKFVSDISFNPT
jgi:hypothetical protein